MLPFSTGVLSDTRTFVPNGLKGLAAGNVRLLMATPIFRSSVFVWEPKRSMNTCSDGENSNSAEANPPSRSTAGIRLLGALLLHRFWRPWVAVKALIDGVPVSPDGMAARFEERP